MLGDLVASFGNLDYYLVTIVGKLVTTFHFETKSRSMGHYGNRGVRNDTNANRMYYFI